MEPLWRQCAAWLNKLNLVPAKHPCLSKHSQPQDLLQLLRNGVILCQAVHALHPNSIDLTKVIYSPPEENSVDDFVCRNNIFLFLHAAVTHFGLRTDHHFFEPPCLYQYQDVGQVFRTVSALSWSERASQFNIPGFPKNERKLEKKLETEEEVYSELRLLYDQGHGDQSAKEEGEPRLTLGKTASGDYEEIYQSVISPIKPKRSRSFLNKKSKREYPVKEFLDTEANYLGNLLMVRDNFRDRITLMSAQSKAAIFRGLDEMIQLHSSLLADLKETNNDIGKVLMKHFGQFVVYRDYCVNLEKSQALLQSEEARNCQLKEELTRCRVEVGSAFPLSGHIVIPFQRLLKYHLMLDAILKYTDESHPQYYNLNLSKQAFTELNLEINELKRISEDEEIQLAQEKSDMAILDKVEASIKSMHLPNRSRLLHHGRMIRAGSLNASGHQGEADYAFLLQTIIILCNKPTLLQHRFRFKFALKLKDYNLVQADDHFRLVNCMNLIPPLVLTTKKKSDLRGWYADLHQCKQMIHPPNNLGHSLLLVSLATLVGGSETKQQPPQCGYCERNVFGLIGQGYRCRSCGVVLHVDCLSRSPGQTCPMADPSQLMEEEEADLLLRRSGSILLPTLGERGSIGSSLSISHIARDNSEQVRQLQEEWQLETVLLPLERQPWFAGDLSLATATERIQHLPVGTFLVRRQTTQTTTQADVQRFALDINTADGVKHLKIYTEYGQHDQQLFSFSAARRFDSLNKLINYYRSHDLLENFRYKPMEGVKLKLPYKNA